MNSACVRIKNGSGFFASENYIVTCHHLFKDTNGKSTIKAGALCDYRFKGQTFKATVMDVEAGLDLVLLHAETAPDDHSFLKLDRVAIPGTDVTVYGYPHNEKKDAIQEPAQAFVGETDEKGYIILNFSNAVTVGYSGGPVCPKTNPEKYNPGKPDSDIAVGVLRTIMDRDVYNRQNEISKMIPAPIVLDLWGDYLEEAHFSLEADPRNAFVYNSLSTVFVDPDENLKELERFAEDTAHVRWKAVVAEGGSGKSRLAYEFARSLPSTWRCCFLRPSDLTVATLDEIYRSAGRDLFIIADYAYNDTNELGKWLSNTIKTDKSKLYSHRIRVLLLQRHGENKKDRLPVPWMDSLLFDENLKEKRYHDEDLILKKLSKPHIFEIMRSYAESREQELGEDDCEAIYKTLINVDETLCRPLFAMFITDAKLNGDPLIEWDIDTALSYFINRELNLLKDAFSSIDYSSAAKKLWVLATMAGGYAFTTESLPDVIAEAGTLISPANLGRTLHRACFAKQDKDTWTMYAMTPDVLGEYFVLKYARDNYTSIEELMDEALKKNEQNTRDFLTRMFADHATDLEMIDIFCRNDASLSFDVSWGFVMRADYINLQAMYKKTGDYLWLVQYARGLVNYIGHQSEKEESDRALKRLEEVYKENQGNSEVAVQYARGLYNHSCAQSEKEESGRALKRLEEVYKENQGNSEVAGVYARGLFNHFNHQSEKEESGRALKRLEEVYKENQGNSEVAVQYARGLVNYIGDQSEKEESGRALKRLEEVYKENQGNSEVAVQYARGLYNHFCAQSEKEESGRALKRLEEVYKENQGNSEVAGVYASGLYNHFCAQSEKEESGRALKRLEEVYKENQGNSEVAVRYASGLFNHFNHQSEKEESGRALKRLEEVYKENQGNSEVAGVYARGLVNYIGHQSEKEESGRALKRLEEVYKENQGNSEVAVRYARGLFNHFNHQSEKEESGRALKRLEEVYKENQGNSEVAGVYARGLVNYIGDQSEKEESGRALKRLEEVYKENQGNVEVAVQYASGLFNYFNSQSN